MTSNVYIDSKNYMNIQGLGNLKGESKTNPQQAKHEVAQQFESILVQMLIKSMRDSNNALFNSEETDSGAQMYQDMFDNQVSLSISGKSIGLGKAIEQYIGQIEPQVQDTQKLLDTDKVSLSATPPLFPTYKDVRKTINSAQNVDPAGVDEHSVSDNALNFVKNLWADAKKAAFELGVDPKLLIAQAALETGWGKKIIAHNDDKGSSFNLFNIKADSSWNKDAVSVNTLEEKDGIVFKDKSEFRAYSSFGESFNDYVQFIKNNPRYQHALKEASNPDSYIKSLQQANYATDSAYSEKVMNIYKGDRLNNILQNAELV